MPNDANWQRRSFDAARRVTMDDEVLMLAQLLACPTRLAALRAVGEKGMGVTEVARVTGVTLSTASHHLGRLLDAGMVRVRRCGRRRVYRLARRKWFIAVEDSPSGSAGAEEDARG
jgi:DNA-binding transcriptional ArsR family regulator